MRTTSHARQAFTLIELLIVVAIIAILAAIAVPNFLEAQTRAKVSRAKADMRSIVVAVEAYHVDNNNYPMGSDNPANYPEAVEQFLTPLGLQKGYYHFRTRGAGGLTAGRNFATVTTPVSYISTLPTDPFAGQAARFLTYCYRNAGTTKNAWVMTSFGPDADVIESVNGKLGAGTANTNPLSTASDTGNPARLGDVNERGVVHFMENTQAGLNSAVFAGYGGLEGALQDLSYDATNGTISDGDIVFVNGLGIIGK